VEIEQAVKGLSSPETIGGQRQQDSGLLNSSQQLRGEELDLTQFQSEGGVSVHAYSEISYQYGDEGRRGRAEEGV
jgi:hypothetical protein